MTNYNTNIEIKKFRDAISIADSYEESQAILRDNVMDIPFNYYSLLYSNYLDNFARSVNSITNKRGNVKIECKSDEDAPNLMDVCFIKDAIKDVPIEFKAWSVPKPLTEFFIRYGLQNTMEIDRITKIEY